MNSTEISRIRHVYEARMDSVDMRLYTPFDPAHMLLHFSRQRAFINLLKEKGIFSLSGKKILDIGCGSAEILSEYLVYGANPGDLYGIDALPDQLTNGIQKIPGLHLLCSDGQYLPFSNQCFDLVSQYTVFTSILEPTVRYHLANQIQRVLKPGGLIVFYDFWPDNPKNKNVHGVKIREVRRLFPNCSLSIRRIVLAPPISRKLAHLSSTACIILEKIPFLCSHYLIGIQQNDQ